VALKSIIDIDLSKVTDLVKIMDRWQKIVERGPPA
jgi:hypothetical protein